MKIDRGSLLFRIAVPAILIVAVVFVVLLLVISRISDYVQDDYSRFIVTAAGMETQKILSATASELTSANLLGNQAVGEAMQGSTSEALNLLWARTGHHGVIAFSNGAILTSSLSRSQTSAILAGNTEGYYRLTIDGIVHYCYMERFPLWGWKVVTVIRTDNSLMSLSGIKLLIPVVFGGCLLMVAGLFLVLRSRFSQPLIRMVSAVERGEPIEATGVAELDLIGGKVNSAVRSLNEKTAALNSELLQRVQVERKVRERDEHIRLLLDYTAEGIYGVDQSGDCTFCNPSCLRMLGYDEEVELLGKNIHNLIHHTRVDGTPYPEQECRAYMAHRERKMIYEAGEVFWRRDGGSFPVEYWAHPVFKDGNIAGTVVTFVDISKRKQLEGQLLQSQKLESIGRLAGGIAHDFNNLLTPIIGYSDLLKRDIPEGSPSAGKVGQILKAADKARILVQQLLSFSRKQLLNMKVTDLNQVVLSFLEILRRTVRENIEIRTELAVTSCGIMADAHQIEQIIMNLAVNAQDAIKGNGVITIETALVQLEEDFCLEHEDFEPGRYMMLAVGDNGCGMDRKTLDMIFEPFFTTKGVGHGTGLGLSTVHGLVKQHGGNIQVDSEPGHGAAFKCFFPVIDEFPVIEPVDASAQTVFDRPEYTFLLVEDNEMARELAYEILQGHGFKVIVAETPLQALEMVNGLSIDVLVTDVVMPGMTGPELQKALVKLNPALKTLFMSGYTSNIILEHGVQAEESNFIQKPFTVREFNTKLESLFIP